MSASHREALAQLVYGIKARRGFVVLTGEVGTGKTTMIQCLLDELNSTTKTALIFNMVVSPKDLMRYVCEKFGLVPNQEHPKEIHDYVSLLERFLLESYRGGDNVALIIDEAQNLSTEVLENVRLLSNFETAQDKLLQILLVGQPELGTRLNASDLRQIKQRVALRHHLTPLSLADCEKYTAKRLEIAGGNISLFGPKAIDAVHRYSGGIPRLVNIICDNALLTAYALRKAKVEAGMIAEVAKDLQISVSARQLVDIKAVSVLNSDESSTKEVKFRHPQAAEAVVAAQISDPGFESPLDNREQVSSVVLLRNEPKTSEKIIPIPVRSRDQTGADSEPASDKVPSWFFGYMTRQLTDAMGPMADFVLREQITAMGESMESFPKERLAQLVEETSSEILDDSLKAGYKRAIINEIYTLNGAKENRSL